MSSGEWVKAQGDQPLPSFDPGSTAYFGDDVPPKPALDPHLFDAHEKLHPDVRALAINTVSKFLTQVLGLRQPDHWLHLWITGSSAGYQWAIDADFDIMVGVNIVRFSESNPDFGGFDETDLAAWLNEHLKGELWPALEHLTIHGAPYEMTYFMNVGTGDNVLNIHPYTAYDIIANQWVLHPSVDRIAYHSRFPVSWFARATEDTNRAHELGSRYNALYNDLTASQPNSPGYINAQTGLNLVAAQARALYDDIHLGRQMAFQGGGSGNLDWHNFRWQMAIKSGTVNALQPIVHAQSTARQLEETEQYGAPLEGADALIRRAMLYRRNG